MFYKLLIIFFIFFSQFLFAISNSQSNFTNCCDSNHYKGMLGGWSVMFFSKYEKNKIEQIVHLVKNDRVKRLCINYPSSRIALAQQINKNINKNVRVKISMCKIDLQDTKLTQYEHKKIVVVLYFDN